MEQRREGVGVALTRAEGRAGERLLRVRGAVVVAVPGARNQELEELLAEAHMSVKDLAISVNTIVGSRFAVAESTVWEWRNKGRLPTGDLPHVVSHILENRLNREIDGKVLWGPRLKSPKLILPADHGLHGLQPGLEGVVKLHEDWSRSHNMLIGLDRRQFVDVWSAGSVAGVLSHNEISPKTSNYFLDASPGKYLTPSMLDALEVTTSKLRQLDDHEGGHPENLHFVHHHFMAVGDFLKNGRCANSTIVNRLITCYAEVCRLAAWMAFDAEAHGMAQRYFFTGLQAARTVGDRALAAHILAFLSYQSVYREQFKRALDYVDAASDVAANTPAKVRSLIAAREARVHASFGRISAYQSAAETARAHLVKSRGSEQPVWMYWFDESALEANLGCSLLVLGRMTSRRKTAGALYKEGDACMERLLSNGFAEWPRDELFYATWKMRSLLWRGEHEESLRIGESVVSQIRGGLRHPQSITQLKAFRNEMEVQGVKNESRIRYVCELGKGIV